MFIPELAQRIEKSSLTFLDKEQFTTDVTQGEVYEADLVAQVKLKERESLFLIHSESQAQPQALFSKRMFCYFARLHEKYNWPVYPLEIFSFDKPKREQSCQYDAYAPTLHVLTFRYKVIQLNRLNWRQYMKSEDAVAAALMAKMAIAPNERADVKLECLRMIATLKLDRAKSKLIAGFVDSYLQLAGAEQQSFERKLGKIGVQDREGIMEIVTSWMEEGIRKGRIEGRMEGRSEGRMEGRREAFLELVTRLLKRRLGALSPNLLDQIHALQFERLEILSESLLDFGSSDDLRQWLHGAAPPID